MNGNTLTRAMTTDGSARVLLLRSTAMVNDAIAVHRLSPTAAAALGRTLTASSMIGVMLKNPADSVTLSIRGDGEGGRILSVSDYYGNTKGYIENPRVSPPLNAMGKLDVARAVGKGSLYVIKDTGEKEPYIGVSSLVSGEIAEDITHYFAVSEQIPTLCGLGVLVERDYTCRAAGGFLIQLLPGAQGDIIGKLEKRAADLPSVSALFDGGGSNAAIIKDIMGDIGVDLFDELAPSYLCDCSDRRVRSALISLGAKELADMAREGKPVDVNCQFCEKSYHFDIDEIKKLLEGTEKQ